MTIVKILLVLYAFSSLLYWLWMAYGSVRILQAVPLLAKLNPPQPLRWPSLSVIVPARNEADKLEAAAQTLLDEDYPNLQIVLVDDRSTDRTSQIIDRLAERDDRVKAIHISDLPEGWMGKVHALHRGFAQCSGQFVLFTDADVHFAPGTLRKALSYCLQRKLDHLAAFPDLWPTSFILDSMIFVFIRHFLMFVSRPWSACKPNSRAFLGIGAFNLVRRSAFEATEGFEWLRREVTDDMGLALLMKRSGAKCASVAAFGQVGLHWYTSIREAGVGAEKGFATLSNFSLSRTLAIALLTLVMEVAPIILLLFLFFDNLRLIGYAGVAVFIAFVFSIIVVTRWGKARILPNLASPLAAWLMAAMFIRAGLVGRRRGGIAWRGTLYSARQFREGKRVHFP